MIPFCKLPLNHFYAFHQDNGDKMFDVYGPLTLFIGKSAVSTTRLVSGMISISPAASNSPTHSVATGTVSSFWDPPPLPDLNEASPLCSKYILTSVQSSSATATAATPSTASPILTPTPTLKLTAWAAWARLCTSARLPCSLLTPYTTHWTSNDSCATSIQPDGYLQHSFRRKKTQG